jgi:hypothetical protein
LKFSRYPVATFSTSIATAFPFESRDVLIEPLPLTARKVPSPPTIRMTNESVIIRKREVIDLN